MHIIYIVVAGARAVLGEESARIEKKLKKYKKIKKSFSKMLDKSPL